MTMCKYAGGSLRAQVVIGLVAGLACGVAFADDVEPTKAGGDLIAGSGIDATNYVTDSNGLVATYLKVRGRTATGFATQPPLRVGDTYIVLSGEEYPGANHAWWQFDWQFTPKAGDTGSTTGGTPNYGLGMFVDTDPNGGTNFGSAALLIPMFDADTDAFNSNPNSWDDSDGFFLNPGPGVWSDDSIGYVYSQSWRYEFIGLAPYSLGPGDYQLRWAAYADENATAGDNPMVVSALTARVIDAAVTNLSLDAQDSCLGASENQLVVLVDLANAQAVIEGGQFFLSYDNTKLDFVSAAPAGAFGQEIVEMVDEFAGTITYAVGVVPGNPGTSAAGPMATLTFDVLGDFCSTDDLVTFTTGILPTRVTDDQGTDISGASLSLNNLGAVTKDSVPPVLSLPSDVSQNADAGVCSAVIDPGLASATDDCSDVGLVTVNFERSDGATSLADPYTTGITTITWTAEDACGNTTSDTQAVVVNSQNTMLAEVELQATVDAGPFDRCITFELTPSGGGVPVEVKANMTFNSGFASQAIDIPCGDYECVTARDTLHTLRKTDDEFGIVGSDYVAGFTVSDGNDELVGGNLNDDSYIDILDFGIFIGQFGDSVGADTPCASFVASTDALAYAGDFSRYATLADAQSSSSPVTGPTAIPNRATAAPFDTPNRDGGLFAVKDAGFYYPDSAAFLTSWYYTTAAGTGYGWGNPNNTTVGFVQMYDELASTVSSWDGYFDNFDGTYWTDFHMTIKGGDASYDDAYSRLWNVDAGGSSAVTTAGEFVSYDLELHFTGLQGVDAGGGFVEALNHPSAVTGTFTAVFDNQDFGGSDDNAYDGYYRAELTFNDDVWAASQGYQYDSGGNVPGLYGSYFYGAPALGSHADIDGDGVVGTGDFTFIQINFLQFSEDDCVGNVLRSKRRAGEQLAKGGIESGRSGPVTRISVAELRRRGMGSLAQGDLNGDGMLDTSDIYAFLGGARPDRVGDVDRNGVIERADLMVVLESLGNANSRGDVNGDGVVDINDLQFVAARLGMRVGE